MELAGYVWKNGQFIKAEEAQIHFLTNTLHYGSGVFEGIRCYDTEDGPAVFRLQDHVKRLFRSLNAINRKISFSPDEINEAILETIKLNNLQEGYIRPLITLGEEMGVGPSSQCATNVYIATWPWGRYLKHEQARIKVSSIRKTHPSTTANIETKVCGFYANGGMASDQVKNQGYTEALLLDCDGYVAEGPGENIFIVKDNIIYTPQRGNILPGITRDSIIKLAHDQNIETKEMRLTLEDVFNADEAFFTGTAAEVSPILSITEEKSDREWRMSHGAPGPITLILKEAYANTVRGRASKYRNWLTHLDIPVAI